MSNTTKTHAMDMSALGRSQQELNMDKESIALEVPDLSLFYDTKQALHNVSMRIPRNRVTAFIGPSGCGKTTVLSLLLRYYDADQGKVHLGSVPLAVSARLGVAARSGDGALGRVARIRPIKIAEAKLLILAGK